MRPSKVMGSGLLVGQPLTALCPGLVPLPSGLAPSSVEAGAWSRGLHWPFKSCNAFHHLAGVRSQGFHLLLSTSGPHPPCRQRKAEEAPGTHVSWNALPRPLGLRALSSG